MKLITIYLAILFSIAGCNVSFNTENKTTPSNVSSGTSEQQAEAESAARSYLAMIDQKQYKETWLQVGPALSAQLNEFTWVNTLTLTRKAFDGGANRQVEGFAFTPQIEPHVPVGEYVLVQFKDIAGNVTTTEKVVMQKDGGKWKIVGYTIFKNQQFGGDN